MIKTYKFKLFYSKRKFKYLKQELFVFSRIYNHSLALIRRHYKMYGVNPTKYTLHKHFKKLMDRGLHPEWKELGYSQGIQEVHDRLYRSYSVFFKWCKKERRSGKKSPPKFKGFRKYKSFTLKQACWKLDESNNKIRIGRRTYRYNKSRDIKGTPKTLTVKRDLTGNWFIYVVCDLGNTFSPDKIKPMTGKNAGFDFGLNTFLVSSDNERYHSGQFLKQNLKEVKLKNRALSRTTKGSKRRIKARIALAKAHQKVVNKRTDTFFKLASDLLSKYDNLIFEDLNIAAMKKLWGRKVSDYAFTSFLLILENKTKEFGKNVHKINRFFPSSKLCSKCGTKKEVLTLNNRTYKCSNCKIEIDRDLNASYNILKEGVSSFSLDCVRRGLNPAVVA